MSVQNEHGEIILVVYIEHMMVNKTNRSVTILHEKMSKHCVAALQA
jgi:hypothetical protein